MTSDETASDRSLVIRYSFFVTARNTPMLLGYSNLAGRPVWTYTIIVSPRAGPTLTIDNFAPVNSEMYLTYFLAAAGSSENFRAAPMDVFQPRISSYTGSQFAN